MTEKRVNTSARPTFVVQQHAATSLHYDFRLEINGMMKSWAIPKGPSLNPKERRLAILTKDHPISYNNFEGIIPKGEYGAGTVIVWDRGHYKNIKTNKQGKPLSMRASFQQGTIEVCLSGKKLKGNFALVCMKGTNWLLIKMKDSYANEHKNITRSAPQSVKSGKTIKEILT